MNDLPPSSGECEECKGRGHVVTSWTRDSNGKFVPGGREPCPNESCPFVPAPSDSDEREAGRCEDGHQWWSVEAGEIACVRCGTSKPREQEAGECPHTYLKRHGDVWMCEEGGCQTLIPDDNGWPKRPTTALPSSQPREDESGARRCKVCGGAEVVSSGPGLFDRILGDCPLCRPVSTEKPLCQVCGCKQHKCYPSSSGGCQVCGCTLHDCYAVEPSESGAPPATTDPVCPACGLGCGVRRCKPHVPDVCCDDCPEVRYAQD